MLVRAVGVRQGREHQGQVAPIQPRDSVGEVDGDAEFGEAGGDAEHPVVAAAAPGQCSRVEGGHGIAPSHPRVPRLLGLILIGEFDELGGRQTHRPHPCATSNRMEGSAVSMPDAPRERASANSAALRSLAVTL